MSMIVVVLMASALVANTVLLLGKTVIVTVTGRLVVTVVVEVVVVELESLQLTVSINGMVKLTPLAPEISPRINTAETLCPGLLVRHSG